MTITELQSPIEPSLAEELIDFWEAIFGISFAGLRGVLAGGERRHNRDFFFLVRAGERLVGTCHLTFPIANPEVGGLGEVAIDPEFRRQGIAGALCAKARDVFRDRDGKAIFLGTTEPNAARVYGRLGWRTLDGTNVMVLTFGSRSAEEFFANYFSEGTTISVSSATSADRTAMIPLLIAPHNWRMLDANIGMYSTRYATQKSCMGLYPRYQALRVNEQGDWFVARRGHGRVMGLATVRLDDQGRARVDAFAHPHHLKCVGSLIDESVRWGVARTASALEVVILEDDAAKLAQFESAGFRLAGLADPFESNGQRYPAVCLEMPVATHEFTFGEPHGELDLHTRKRAVTSERS